MSLLRLPPEILMLIFDQIGSSFSREDLGRLTVCKQWLGFALPACFKCITLSQETLRNLITSGIIKKSFLLTNSLETIDLELRGYQSCIFPPYSQEYAQEPNSLNATSSNEASRDNTAKTCIKTLKNVFAQLAIVAQQSNRLRTLRIRAWSSPEPASRPGDYLTLATMQAFLSLEKLRVLVLDLSGSFLDASGEQGNSYHICPAIGALLRTLRTLHLRMRSICPDVLKPRDPDDSLHLSVVAINLSHPGIMSVTHSKQCGSRGGGVLRLKAAIQEQGEVLATRMASPKTIRILNHSLPQFEIQSLDVLTGKTIILDDDMAWDEDSKTVKEESEPESEITDDGFSTFLDE
ncbi:uncharacterized protein TRUGW13939_06004 [Talaromyces rugulosus]|uniref:Uncharacterized protein n=1 Tax=Talaromyces rugulosus TaxID=121627 RepID=A0A7H8QYM6_TALRU|nr:uncharacterized protein TRUGW13939_06004 [Talaromyces rugulosus]QKX58876.1 hypothetical protein TRUGW13939_06004 [Talaromyces rugulosus]